MYLVRFALMVSKLPDVIMKFARHDWDIVFELFAIFVMENIFIFELFGGVQLSCLCQLLQ